MWWFIPPLPWGCVCARPGSPARLATFHWPRSPLATSPGHVALHRPSFNWEWGRRRRLGCPSSLYFIWDPKPPGEEQSGLLFFIYPVWRPSSCLRCNRNMNIFRLTGDLSHLAAIIILLLKIWKSRSCAGKMISFTSSPASYCEGNSHFFYLNELRTCYIAKQTPLATMLPGLNSTELPSLWQPALASVANT